MAQFDVGGKTYVTGQIDAFKQLLIVKRLAPLLPHLTGLSAVFAPPDESGLPAKFDITALGPKLAEALSLLSDDDFLYIMQNCLSVTQRMENDVLSSPVYNKAAKVMQYRDIDAMSMLIIMTNVLVDNIASFSSALAASGTLPGAVQTTSR